MIHIKLNLFYKKKKIFSIFKYQTTSFELNFLKRKTSKYEIMSKTTF